MTTHYDTLGVEPTASPDEIKRAYRKRARETHPDHGGDTAEAAQVNGAYLVLSDPAKRERYDQTGQDQAPRDELAQAMAVAGQFFDKALAEAGEMPTTKDLIAGARRMIEAERLQGQMATQSLHAMVKRTKRVIKRVRHNGNGPNFIVDRLNETVRKTEWDIATNTERLATLAKAAELLGNYQFVMDAPTMAPNPFPSASAAGYSMGWDIGRPTY